MEESRSRKGRICSDPFTSGWDPGLDEEGIAVWLIAIRDAIDWTEETLTCRGVPATLQRCADADELWKNCMCPYLLPSE